MDFGVRGNLQLSLLFSDGYYSNPEAYFKCKNSTLLDTSKAVTIDKVPQLANLSEILGNPLT